MDGSSSPDELPDHYIRITKVGCCTEIYLTIYTHQFALFAVNLQYAELKANRFT